ncbi:glycosyltransferase family 39 protein [Saccharopolyspora spinosporotrichia]
MSQTTVPPATAPGEPGASPPAPARLSPRAWWPVLSIAAVVAAVQVAISPFGGYWIDEIYMLAVGRYHPDWGYADQPPVAPLLARAMDWIAPDWLPLLRLPATLASAATVVLTALIARELGADRRAQVIAAAAAATGLWAAFVGHWVTPYTIEPPLWLLMSWLLVRWVRLHGEGAPTTGCCSPWVAWPESRRRPSSRSSRSRRPCWFRSSCSVPEACCVARCCGRASASRW